MAEGAQPTPTVWQALNGWAGTLRPWQRAILAHAIKTRVLAASQIEEVYDLFLQEAGLKEKKAGPEITVDVAGRPAEALTKTLRLEKIDSLGGINALPDGATLTFGSALTVVYGRNGAGKSGFARLFANACFSRNKPSILGNIYGETAPLPPTAQFHITVDGVLQSPLAFTQGVEHPELKRLSLFDVTIARQHVSETSPFEFKPSGFDIFPEMARVYSQIGVRLDADVKTLTHDLKFSDSFIGLTTEVSAAVASIGAATDLATLEKLAAYGPTETARFDEVDKQLTLLKANSHKDAVATLKQARSDIESLSVKVGAIGDACGPEKTAARNGLASKVKEASDFARTTGSDQFKRSFFNAVGSPEWEGFAKSTHALARKEGEQYPEEKDRCLLCERPFDEPSRAHVAALLAFVEGDAQRAAQEALADLEKELEAFEAVEINIFAEGSRVREHIHRIDPAAEMVLADLATKVASHKNDALKALRAQGSVLGGTDTAPTNAVLAALLKRIDEDVVRLEKEDQAKAIAELELERQTIRHREVLSQLMPKIRTEVSDAKWCMRAAKSKSALSPRPITEKEKELFGEIIGESYRTRLASECNQLGCTMPIELQTAGQKGKTVRSLAIKGGYPPDAILSEGEQKAVALADFLTEVGLNPGNAGIVLDDPVTSQDHERKQLIANRLVDEAKRRQVIVFTHDLPFLNQIILQAESDAVPTQSHWIERNSHGEPGQITLNDVPATSKQYDTVDRARHCLAEAKAASGTAQRDAIMRGMGALRRTVEETVVKKLFKLVVPRWQDRVIVTALRKVVWDNALVDEMVDMYEELSAYVEGHSHTDEAMGAPPEPKELEQAIARLDALIKRARAERPVAPVAGRPTMAKASVET